MTRELVATPLSAVRTRRVEWVYTDRIPLRTGTILAGQGGIAKSTIISDIIAKATRGELPGTFLGRPISVGVISPEDDDESVLAPRLIAAGADLTRVFNFSKVTVSDNDRSWTTLPNIQDDLPRLGEQIFAHEVRLLVVDPLVSIMVGNSISQSDVRRNFDPLSSLAAELDFALLAVAHFGKSGERAGDRLSGSHAFRDVARSLIVAAVDEDTNNRILTVEKSNYSPTMPSDAYEIESAKVQMDDGYTQSVGRAVLLGQSSVTVQQIMDRDRDTSKYSDNLRQVVAEVGKHPDGVATAQVVQALDGEVHEAIVRKYLTRAVDQGLIERTSRGIYAPLSHVSGVSTVPSQDTRYTKDTLHVENHCPKCGEPSAEANAAFGYAHPNCGVAV